MFSMFALAAVIQTMSQSATPVAKSPGQTAPVVADPPGMVCGAPEVMANGSKVQRCEFTKVNKRR